MDHLTQLHFQLQPLRDQLYAHPICFSMIDKNDVRAFMESHVFAALDFMFLATRFKEHLLKLNPEKLNEESEGFFTNRFVVYKRAMMDAGAQMERIARLGELITTGMPMERAMLECQLPPHITQFLSHTCAILREDDPVVLAANFAFGREDLLPILLEQLTGKMLASGDESMKSFAQFVGMYGEERGRPRTAFAGNILAEWCGNDLYAWTKSLCAADDALRARIALWNGIHESMLARKIILN